jgi:predicted metalloprotease
MRLEGTRRSQNIEDRRGRRASGGMPVRMGGLGVGGLLVVVVISYLMGVNPLEVLDQTGGGPAPPSAGPPPGGPAANDPGYTFVSKVLADTEDTWEAIFQRGTGRRYPPPTLVVFNDAVDSACGMNSAAVGPFYCPADQKVYIDLAFFRDLEQRFGAPGDFARAYVIAHEVGHHVQNVLGVFDQVRQRSTAQTANDLSVRQELQADCFAGVWGHYAAQKQMLEPGDVEEGLNAAAAIGDDRIQRRTQGRVAPESWTHGSSEQRAEWFRRGLDSGRPDACDTFAR